MMTSLRSKWAAGKTVRAGLAVGGRMSKSICNRSGSGRTAAGPFSTQPSGPRPVGCFCRPAAAGLARPVSVQIWALRSRLEKQPTDPAAAGRCHHYMRDGTLARLVQNDPGALKGNEASAHHWLKTGKERLDLFSGIHDLNDHREIHRKPQNF